MGSVETLRAGELQRMTAGIGIVHSEFNASKTEPLHFFQIWIRPSRNGLTPSYEPMALTPAEQKAGKLFQVAPPDTGAMKINQDARVFVGDVTAGRRVEARPRARPLRAAAPDPRRRVGERQRS